MSECRTRKQRGVDLTRGGLVKGIALFALPLLGSSLVQQLYNTVDLVFVGQFLGTAASSGIGVSSLLATCLVGFFAGVSVGVNVTLARLIGARDDERSMRTVHTATALGIGGGAAVALAGILLAPLYVRWMGAPDDIVPDALTYMRIYFIGVFFLVVYDMCSGVMRAAGDTATPLVAQAVGGVANVALDALFLLVLNGGVAGVTWATVIAQAIAAAIVVHRLALVNAPWRLEVRKVRVHRDLVGPILSIGIPTGLQSFVITLSNVFVQAQINSLDTVAIGAFTAYYKVELIIYLGIVAIGQTTTTLVAQNLGAGQPQRARRGVRTCALMGVFVAAATSIFCLALSRQLFAVMNPDPPVVDAGTSIAAVTFPFYWVYAILEVYGAAIRGHGKATASMAVVIANLCALRTVALLVMMGLSPDIRSVAVCYPLTWLSTALCMVFLYRRILRKGSLQHAA